MMMSVTRDQRISENFSPIIPKQDQWVKTSWANFLEFVNQPENEKAKCYYHRGDARIETMHIGSDHANDHALLLIALRLMV
jgi:hypothetical protein